MFRCIRQYNEIIQRKLPTPTSARPYQARTAKFIQQKLCRQLSVKFKFREIEALYGSSKADARFYTVYAIFSGMLIFRVESEEALIIELA